MGLKSCWQGCFHYISQPDGCLESCGVTAGGETLGIGEIPFFFNLIFFLALHTTPISHNVKKALTDES